MTVDALLVESTGFEPSDALVLLEQPGGVPDNVFDKDRVIEGLHRDVPLVPAFQKRINRGGRRLFGDCYEFFNRSEEHTSELQSHLNLVCRLLLEKKNCTHRRRHYTDPAHVLTSPLLARAR